MDTFRVFVYMLMRDASLKQRIPCIIRISIFGAFSAGKKCALYKGKYGIWKTINVGVKVDIPFISSHVTDPYDPHITLPLTPVH